MTKEEFLAYLLTRPQFDLEKTGTKQAKKFDVDLTKKLQSTAAVLVCDSSGFTKKTRKYGIIHYLANLMQSYTLSFPIIAKHSGTLIKNEADNLIATFKTPKDAVGCAVDIQAAHRQRNAALTDAANEFHVCMGIDYGKFLKLNDDVFGDAVNVAYKLGEDLAGREEILVSQSVHEKIKGSHRVTDMGLMDVGHIETPVYRIEWLPKPESGKKTSEKSKPEKSKPEKLKKKKKKK
ncbi:MAG: adenylate/guanylate cyclase domain-containing protein [Rhizobacter sp.]|nr:adenylate/guanylate cyclase domain-containing protein [Chlorobiales bacterium]